MIGIYCRDSVHKKKDKVSIEVQEKHGVQFAKDNGFEYIIYKDVGISAYGNYADKRPQFEKLMNDVTTGVIDSIYIYERSRNDRDIITWVMLANFLRDNNIPIYIKGKLKDLRDRDVYYPLVDQSANDQRYVEETTEKIIDAIDHNIELGKIHGRPPYGYTKGKGKKLVIDENDSKIVKRIYELSRQGNGTDKIAEILNADNIPTMYSRLKGTLTTYDKKQNKTTTKPKKDIKWSGNSVRGIIKNTHYKGIRTWKGKGYPVPAIVSVEYWEQAQEILKRNNNTKGRKPTQHKYLLKDFIRCGKCGRNYYGRSREDKSDHYYMCSSKRRGQETCGNRSVHIDKIETFVWFLFTRGVLLDKVKAYYKQLEKENPTLEIDEKLKVLDDRLNNIEIERGNVINFIRKGIISEEDARSDMQSIKRSIKGIETERTNLIMQKSNIEDLLSKDSKTIEELNWLNYEEVDSYHTPEEWQELAEGRINWKDMRRIKKAPERPDFNNCVEILKKYIKDIYVVYDAEFKRFYIEVVYLIDELNPDIFTFYHSSYYMEILTSQSNRNSFLIDIEIPERYNKQPWKWITNQMKHKAMWNKAFYIERHKHLKNV